MSRHHAGSGPVLREQIGWFYDRTTRLLYDKNALHCSVNMHTDEITPGKQLEFARAYTGASESAERVRREVLRRGLY